MSSNGCGPRWLPRWLTDVLFNWFFLASCNEHDRLYRMGGTEADRRSADMQFWHYMMADIGYLPMWQKPIAFVQALAYLLIVRAFGWMRFKYHG